MKATQPESHLHRREREALAAIRFGVLSAKALSAQPPTFSLDQARIQLEASLPELSLELVRVEISPRGRIVAVVRAASLNPAGASSGVTIHRPTFPPGLSVRPNRRGEARVELFALAGEATPHNGKALGEIHATSCPYPKP